MQSVHSRVFVDLDQVAPPEYSHEQVRRMCRRRGLAPWRQRSERSWRSASLGFGHSQAANSQPGKSARKFCASLSASGIDESLSIQHSRRRATIMSSNVTVVLCLFQGAAARAAAMSFW